MKQIFYFLFAMLGGLLLHQTASITHKMPKGWQQLTGTTIGVQGTLPFFAMFLKKMGLPNKVIFLAIMAFQVAFLCVGIGVAGGWVVDTIFDIDREAVKEH